MNSNCLCCCPLIQDFLCPSLLLLNKLPKAVFPIMHQDKRIPTMAWFDSIRQKSVLYYGKHTGYVWPPQIYLHLWRQLLKFGST